MYVRYMDGAARGNYTDDRFYFPKLRAELDPAHQEILDSMYKKLTEGAGNANDNSVNPQDCASRQR